MQKILDHNTTEFYPGDDYTQYKARGHYERDLTLERSFENHRIRQNQTISMVSASGWGGVFSGGDYGISEEEPTLVADVCTNSDTGKVLHEGVGRFNPIIIAYGQPDGTVLAGVGYMMSYYEFEEENFTKVSDSEWRKRVETGALPSRPLWTELSVPSGRVDNPSERRP